MEFRGQERQFAETLAPLLQYQRTKVPVNCHFSQYQSKWRAKDQNATKVEKTNGKNPFPAVGKNEKVPLSLFRCWLIV